jgi:hypothetical protein
MAEITARLEDLADVSVRYHRKLRVADDLSTGVRDIGHLIDAYNVLAAAAKSRSQKRKLGG